MGFNKKNYKMIREKYATKYRIAESMAEERRDEVEKNIPEIAVIDGQLRDLGPTMFELMIKNDTDATDKFRERMQALQKKKAELLVAHGYPADYCVPLYECPICADTGYVDCRMCACMKRELIMAGYASSGLGYLLKDQTFDTFRLDYYRDDSAALMTMTQNLRLLQAYARNFSTEKGVPDSFLLLGGTGLGKTHLSTAVAGVLLERGYDVRYVTAINLMADFERKQFRTASAEETDDPTADYFDCDLLILDDLGTELANQFTVSCLYNVIDTRLNRGLATIINTNLSQNDLRTRYWDRVTSRLFGAYRPLLFRGTDVRIQKIGN